MSISRTTTVNTRHLKVHSHFRRCKALKAKLGICDIETQGTDQGLPSMRWHGRGARCGHQSCIRLWTLCQSLGRNDRKSEQQTIPRGQQYQQSVWVGVLGSDDHRWGRVDAVNGHGRRGVYLSASVPQGDLAGRSFPCNLWGCGRGWYTSGKVFKRALLVAISFQWKSTLDPLQQREIPYICS